MAGGPAQLVLLKLKTGHKSYMAIYHQQGKTDGIVSITKATYGWQSEIPSNLYEEVTFGTKKKKSF